MDSQGDRVLQMIIAMGPLLFLFLARIVLGRSKTLMLAVWLSVGWLVLRVHNDTNSSFIREFARPIARLLEG